MMSEITFPSAASATVAVVGLNAALATGTVPWPLKEQSYFVKEATPTISFIDTSSTAEVADAEFAEEIASVFAALSKGQEPLGAEFETVWDANVDTLYES